MGSRPAFSTVLILGSIVLAIAIYVGNTMGNRVLGQIFSRAEPIATPIPVPSASPGDTVTNRALWKRRRVLSVATDPAFPDPRITPEPEQTATPRTSDECTRASRPESPHSPKGRRPLPAPLATPDTSYTAPAVPVASPSPEATETIAPDEVQTLAPRSPSPAPVRTAVPSTPHAPPTRALPTLPPVSIPNLNPL
ncbi:MAG: hypothetical protein NVS2B3_00430 [Vulcanimicrobiaceae bacterium]